MERSDHGAQSLEKKVLWLAKEVLEIRKGAWEVQGSVSLPSHRVAEAVGIEVSECSSSEDESSEDGSGPNDFESAIAAVQHSRTAERRRSALANKARRCSNGKDRRCQQSDM